jgi:DNA-binding MarR family transcriptional regulator
MSQQLHLGLLLAVTRRRFKQVVSTLVDDRRLSPQQFWTLVTVAEHEGLSLKALAEGRRMDQPTASRLACALVDRGLLSARVDPSDRRALRLSLTASGRALSERLVPIATRVRDAVEGALAPNERAQVVSALGKIVASLDQLEQECRGPSRARKRGASRRPWGERGER